MAFAVQYETGLGVRGRLKSEEREKKYLEGHLRKGWGEWGDAGKIPKMLNDCELRCRWRIGVREREAMGSKVVHRRFGAGAQGNARDFWGGYPQG